MLAHINDTTDTDRWTRARAVAHDLSVKYLLGTGGARADVAEARRWARVAALLDQWLTDERQSYFAELERLRDERAALVRA